MSAGLPVSGSFLNRLLGVLHKFAVPIALLAALFNLRDTIELMHVRDISRLAMFAVPAEILDRYNSCDYKYLFFCELKSNEPPNVPTACKELTGPARLNCEWSDNSQASTSWWTGLLGTPLVRLPILAVLTLPHLPDAFIHVVGNRWSRGHLEFSLGVLFVFAYITLMILALRQKSPGNLWYFAGAVIFGPYVVGLVFWLLQHVLAGASAVVIALAGIFTAALGTLGCWAVTTAHDVESLSVIFGFGPKH
jgi:hypothetical protein